MDENIEWEEKKGERKRAREREGECIRIMNIFILSTKL